MDDGWEGWRQWMMDGRGDDRVGGVDDGWEGR